MKTSDRGNGTGCFRPNGDRLSVRGLALLLCGAGGTLIALPTGIPALPRLVLLLLLSTVLLAMMASLADDDRRLRRLISRLQALAEEEAPSGRRIQGGGLKALETHIEAVHARTAMIEQRLSHRHSLSGLPTREPLFQRIASAMEAGRSGVLGVIHLLDLERLDAFDEALSERLLVTLVGRIRSMLGSTHFLAQIDRARLAVWYGPDVSATSARTQLDAVGYALAGPVVVDGRELLPEIHVSAADSHTDATPSALLARATMAGSGKVAAITGKTSEADALEMARERFAVEQDLRRAVARGELELHYQPLIDAEAGRVCGAEALLRWHHPTRGLIPPTCFIPIMEGAGLADEIGLWVLNAACREARIWIREGLGPLRVAVNISGRQLDDGGLVTLVERTLQRHSLSPGALEIELTETVATAEGEQTAALFAEFRKLGVAIAIDDFGTGYSSLSSLRMLSFDKIKIDREFVTAIHERRDSQAICRSIVALGNGLGIRVLAEGVETVEEFAWLRAQGCSHFQGHYFAPALEADAFLQFVRDGDRLSRLLSPTPSASAPRQRLTI